jgi:hypothetical protein
VVRARTLASEPSQQLYLLAQSPELLQQGSPGGSTLLHWPERQTTTFWLSPPTAMSGVVPPKTSFKFVQGAASPGWVACIQVSKLFWTAADAAAGSLAGVPHTSGALIAGDGAAKSLTR